mgnify:CR=1 FL=1
MQPKAKVFRLRAESPAQLFASRSCGFILLTNWLFQGVRGMDAKELSFRILLLAGSTTGIALFIHAQAGTAPSTALALGLLISHTLNFLVNGQFWVCLRYCPAYRREPRSLTRSVSALVSDVQRQSWLSEAVIIGSLARQATLPGARADIDLRLVFPPGIGNWLRTNLLLLRLRAKAFVAGLPLDLYAYEHPATLRRFDQAEPLGIVLDREARLRRGFANRQLVWLT